MKGIYLILLMFSFGLSAQRLEEKVANELCTCLKDEKVETMEQFDKVAEVCAIRIGQKYLMEIYELETKREKDASDRFWEEVTFLSLTQCDIAKKLMASEHKDEEKPAILDCEDLKIGTYYYHSDLSENRNYLTFTKNQVIENRKGGIYTNSSLEWLDKCVYRITLQETNSKFDEEYMRDNPYTFRIIENNPDYFISQTQYIKGAGLKNVKVYKLPYKITK